MEMTNESIISLANYFGEDPTIACEGVKEFMSTAKERILALGKRIKEFIARVINWIKSRFSKYIEITDCKIDKVLWEKSNIVLNKLNNLTDQLKRIHNDTKLDSTYHMVRGNHDTAYAEISKYDKEFDQVSESDDYRFITTFKTKYNKKCIKVDTSQLSFNKKCIIDTLALLNDEYNKLENLFRTVKLNDVTDLVNKNELFNNDLFTAELCIKNYMTILKARIEIIDAVMSCSKHIGPNSEEEK